MTGLLFDMPVATASSFRPMALPKLDRNSRARAFASALGTALEAVHAVHGDGWVLRVDCACIVRVPAPLASYVTDRGTKISLGRDRRVPAARFWSAGALWPGLVPVAEGSLPRAARMR